MRTIYLIYSQNGTETPDLIYACQSYDRAQQIITNMVTAESESNSTVHLAKDGLEGYISRDADDSLVYRAYAASMTLLED